MKIADEYEGDVQDASYSKHTTKSKNKRVLEILDENPRLSLQEMLGLVILQLIKFFAILVLS